MKKNLTFDKAYKELSQLVREIEQDDIKVDTLAIKVKQANELINFCVTKLRTIESEISEAQKDSNSEIDEA